MADERKRGPSTNKPNDRDPDEEGSAGKRHHTPTPKDNDPEEEGSAGKQQF